MDYVEIALDNYTDFVKFERLAIEIMAREGYPHIKKIGGVHDDGIDAEVVYYSDKETETIVFQFSIQKDIQKKVLDTIEKLRESKVKFSELIIVTKNTVNNIEEIRKKVRQTFNKKINLEIYEKTTFIKILSLNKILMLRYFPDIKSQLINDLFEKDTIFSESSEEKLTTSLIKCSLLFTFNKDISHHRKTIFDNTVLAIIVDKKECEIVDIAKEFDLRFHKTIPYEQLIASIERIHKLKLIDPGENKIKPAQVAAERIQGHVETINNQTIELIEEIINKVSVKYENKIDRKLELLLAYNIKKALSLFFRLYGLDYSQNTGDTIITLPAFKIDSEFDIIKLTKDQLPPILGDILVYCLGETIKKPTVQQAIVLANWAKAFIGVQIMGLDPLLKEFQISNLKEKVFLLDTDFVLFCMTDFCPQSSIYKKLLFQISQIGCQIIIPEDVIIEVLRHAEFSVRNYAYFRNTFTIVDEVIIEEKVQNIFVKDFYFANYIHGKHYKGFKEYLDNYYEPTSPFEFIQKVIKQKLKVKLSIKKIEQIITDPIPAETLDQLTGVIYDETIKTFKSFYRTEDENKTIARTDALLYLTVKMLNKDAPHDKSGILIGTHYLMTSSTRSVRCAKKIGINAEIIVKPHNLVSLFNEVGLFETTVEEVVNLFENPFLVEVIDNNWEHIKPLVDAGVDLQNVDITRLSWTLDETIHKYLLEDVILIDEGLPEPRQKPQEEKQLSVDEFIDFANEVKSKGLKFIPQVEALLLKYEQLKAEKKSLVDIQETLNIEFSKFGTRRQKYFDKITQKKTRDNKRL